MFAVTTGLPSLRAASVTVRAVSMPPISSTTKLMRGSFTTLAQSVVSSDLGILTGRFLFTSRTAMQRVFKRTPRRDAMSAPLRSIA